MNLYLQFGHGMIALSKELLTAWAGGGVVLSPRDLDASQIARVGADARQAGSEPLLDPQCYRRDANKRRLVEHDFWKPIASSSTGAFTGGAGTETLLRELAKLARSAQVDRHILPGCIADAVSEDWFSMQEAIIEGAQGAFAGQELLATIALSSAVLLDEAQVEAVVERAAEWKVSGFYVVGEVPGSYLVDNPVWLANLLILVSGLKLIGDKSVIVAYANHQLLCMASAKADVIASGTWLNVRAFTADKFYEPEDDDASRRAKWYYAPQALSEFKSPFLDMAKSAGVLTAIKADTPYAAPLFAGAMPTTIEWSETQAFRHYLTALRAQVAAARGPGFQATVDDHLRILDGAETLVKKLGPAGVRGQDRDFTPYFDVNRAALAKFHTARAARFRRGW